MNLGQNVYYLSSGKMNYAMWIQSVCAVSIGIVVAVVVIVALCMCVVLFACFHPSIAQNKFKPILFMKQWKAKGNFISFVYVTIVLSKF